MITTLSITNFLLIQSVTIDLHPKFIVFTGESGSGKSLIFKAIRFCLGAKIDKSYIGNWDDVMTVGMAWRIPKPAKVFLDDIGINTKEVIEIQHTLSQSKRICKIDGQKIGLRDLKILSDYLVLDSAQGSAEKIYEQSFQKMYIEKCIDPTIIENFSNCSKQFYALKARKENMKLILEQEDESWLQHQVDELSQHLKNPQSVIDVQKQADQYQQISRVKKEWLLKKSDIEKLKQMTYRLGNIESVDISIYIEELNTTLQVIEGLFQDALEIDFETQHTLEQSFEKLQLFQDLARKHKLPINELYAHFESLQQLLFDYDTAKQDIVTIDDEIEAMDLERQELFKSLMISADSFSKDITVKITQQLVLLGMEQASFRIRFLEDTPFALVPVFEIKSNPGQNYKPIQMCLSGGEISRLSILLSLYHNPSTVLMLDEIDSGVSGQIGNQIRDILRALGQKRQVLCISHLAQVASGAHCHFGVYKKLSQKAAETCVDMLLDEKRVEALSKLMCGHVDVEMLGQARRLLELEH